MKVIEFDLGRGWLVLKVRGFFVFVFVKGRGGGVGRRFIRDMCWTFIWLLFFCCSLKVKIYFRFEKSK